MNDNDQVPNPALRAHVTDHSFVLTLRKTHVAALARIVHEENGDLPGKQAMLNLLYGSTSFFVPAVNGLVRRGLVVHRHRPNWVGRQHGTNKDKLSDFYRLTRAGWAAYDLLAEAGLVPLLDRRSAKRRLVA